MIRFLSIAILYAVSGAAKCETRQAGDSTSQGVLFVRGLSWTQVLARARTERKYIFVDCYTTWCGPCKEMDRIVYPDPKVGETYNGKFVCVKMQMDRSSSDSGRSLK